MILKHEQLPNICDGCKERTIIVHFKTKTDEWVSLCRRCQQNLACVIFKTLTERQLIKLMEGLVEKNGQDNLPS